MKITQLRVVLPYRRFGTEYLFHLQETGIQVIGQRGCPETSLWNNHSTVSNISSALRPKAEITYRRKWKNCKWGRNNKESQ